MSKIKTIIFLWVAILVSYGASVRYGFSQDDWFHLSISQAGSIKEFFNFFNPFDVSWIFFRPLSTQVPYWFAFTIFGLDLAPYIMHFMMLIIHLVNSYLVVRISSKYLKLNNSVVLGLLYAVSNIHFLSLFYIGAIQQLISTLFSLLAINLFISKSKPSQINLALLTLCALLSKELALRLPLILLILAYLKDQNVLRSFKSVIGPILVAALYVIFRMIVGSSGASEYVLNFSLATTVATIMWYTLFILGFPERLLSYGLSAGRVNFFGFLRDSGLPAYLVLLAVLIMGLFIIAQLIKTIKNSKTHNLLAYPLLAVIAISPVVFLPTHRYPHYLDLSIMFMGIWLLKSLELKFKSYLVLTVIGLGILSSIYIETNTHWTTKRAVLSKEISQKIISDKSCSSPSGVVFTGTKLQLQEISYAMSIANGPKVLCQNDSLQVYYNELP